MSHIQDFAHPFLYWVGMDTDPRTTPEALAEFNQFYDTVHVHEVVAAHPGFVGASRFELVEPDPRGGVHRGPRWLAVYAMQDEAAAAQYVKDNERPWLHRRRYSPWPAARRRAKTVWRLLWRQLSTTGAANGTADSVALVGANVLPDAAATIAACFELYRAFAHPAPGCPRFCLVSEAEAAAAPAEHEETVWRLVYRRLPLPD
jgi:hypothetical protein